MYIGRRHLLYALPNTIQSVQEAIRKRKVRKDMICFSIMI